MSRSEKRVGSGVCASAFLLATALVLSACGGGDGKPAAGTTSSPSASASSPADPTSSTGPGADVPAGAAPSLPPDPVVKTYKRVLRNGKRPRPTVTAAPAPFDGTIRYGDGLSLAVTGVSQAKVTEQGPGEFPGQPKTQMSLRMTNDGDATVRLEQVVVTAIYGPSRRQARPVYDNKSRDFSGVLKPGKSTTAVYSFSIPKAALGRVTMLVDFDGGHTVATFEGDPRSAR